MLSLWGGGGMAYAVDLKSTGGNPMRVRYPPALLIFSHNISRHEFPGLQITDIVGASHYVYVKPAWANYIESPQKDACIRSNRRI